MIKLTNEIIKNYQIRKTKKQKTEFIELLRAHFPEMRIESGGFLKCRNLVIGDVESAKVVFGAHYDTADTESAVSEESAFVRAVSVSYCSADDIFYAGCGNYGISGGEHIVFCREHMPAL